MRKLNTLIINIYKVDTSGNIIWAKSYNNHFGMNYINDVIKTFNNEYSILISLQYNGGETGVTINIDSLGNVLWAKNIYTNESISFKQLKGFSKTSDNGFLYTGISNVMGTREDVIYLKMDSLFNIDWTRYYSSTSFREGIKVINKNENNYVFCNGGDGMSIAKLDQQGYGFCNFDTLVFMTNSISYDVTNISVSFINVNFLSENFELIFNDVSVDSEIYCSNVSTVNTLEINNTINIYPNPTTEKLRVEATNLKQIEVMDIQGKILKVVYVNNQDLFSIDISEIPKGIFLIKVITVEGVSVQKIIHE